MRPDGISVAALAALTVVWGSSFFLTEIALGGLHPLAIAATRAGLAALCLIAVSMVMGVPPSRDIRMWGWAGAIGLFALALPFSALSWGQMSVDSSIASVLIAASPLFVLGLSRLFLDEAVSARRWFGFALGFCGIMVLVGPPASQGLAGSVPFVGSIACLLAALSYGISAVLIRVMPPIHPLQATCMAAICAAIMLAPLGWSFRPTTPLDDRVLWAVVVLGIVQTGAAHVLRFYTVRRAGPVFMSVVAYLIPIWATFLGVVVLGERLQPVSVAAFALIVAGLFLSRSQARASA